MGLIYRITKRSTFQQIFLKSFKLPFCALLGPMSDDAEVLGTKRRVVNFVVLCECLIKFSFSGRIAFIAQARSTATRVTIRYDT